LYVFGVGFLAANLVTAYVCVQDWLRRHQAILAWRLPPPRFAALPVLISVGLAFLIVYKLLVLEWPVWRLFGEAMMLTYYGYLYPLSLRLKRGFYEQGVRFDRGFVRWEDITGMTWHHEGPPVLVAAYGRQRAGRLTVPLEYLGAARRVLRDRIAAHQIHFTPGSLDLGGHDERQDV
jgi:MFS family permease